MYMDDIVIGGKTDEEHKNHLRQFLQRAKSKRLTISREKSVFWGEKLRFSGHFIKSGTITPDPLRAAPFVIPQT